MKILWLCNIVLPDFSQEFLIKKNNFGGWMTGMLHEMKKKQGIDICLCFPIIDRKRLKDGICNGHEYYTFLCDMNAETDDLEMVEVFENILKRSNPDLIHIWGTEYPHTTAMVSACENMGKLDRVIIHIQGLISICAEHYLCGIPEEYRRVKFENGISMEEEKKLFEKRGEYEIKSIKKIKHVIGRTDWDKACIGAINSSVEYHFCNEILRDSFYQYSGTWEYGRCQKYSIFVSQASYPVKGFHYLLQALPTIIHKFPNTQVYVAGTDILAEKARNTYALYLSMIIERFGLSGQVTFLGNLNEKQMIQQYQRANVFVLASTIENSPNSLSEARMIGVPSVISYVGGAYSGIRFYEDGFLYPHDDPALLAYYICEIFENKDALCERFSKNSVLKTLEANNPRLNADCNYAIYKKIMSGV